MPTLSKSRRAGFRGRGGRRRSNNQNNTNRIGAAWINYNDDEAISSIQIRLSEEFDGQIPEGYRIVLLPNDFKEQAKHPDFNVLLFAPK